MSEASQLDYDSDEIEAFTTWLEVMRDSDEYEHAEFDVAPGVTIDCDWSHDYDEPYLTISVIVQGPGFELFTRGTGKTLTETGSYGWGPNHGDELACDIAGWVADNFYGGFDEMVFEYSDQLTPDAWLFHGSVANPNASWE
jgi:hypothetical protein